MKKRINTVFLSLISSVILISIMSIHVLAASIVLSASTSTVKPGQTFTVYVGGSVTGRVNLSASNGTLSTSSVWVEGGNIAVSVTAGQSGSVSITAAPVEGLANLDGSDADASNRSISIAIVPANSNNGGGSSRPNTPNVPNPGDDSKSQDNDLKGLSVDQGELSPAFSKDVTEYTVSLPASAKSITIGAEANDPKASVTGAGQKDLEAGDNVFEVIVVAENAAAKAYKINVIVDEKPEVFTKFKGKKLGVVRNIRNAPVPPNFVQTTVKLEGKEIPAWANDAMKKTLVYLVDDKNNKQFYLFEKGEITTSMTYTKVLGREVFVIDVPKELQEQIGLKYEKVKIEDVELMGWTFENKGMKNYELIYVMDLDGESRFYQHEKSQNTLQLYSGAAPISQANYEKEIEILKNGKLGFLLWACGATILLVGAVGFIAFKGMKKNK